MRNAESTCGVCRSFGAWRSRTRDEERAREPDDVEVVAVDPLDEAAAEALDRVRAGAALPLPARDVGGDRLCCQKPEGHIGQLVRDDHVLVGAEQAEPGDDGVRAARRAR